VLSFCQPARNRQPEAGRSRVGSSARGAVKWREHSIAVCGGNPRAAVGYAKHDLSVVETRRHFNWRVDRRVPEGVVYEVAENSERVNEVEATEGKGGRIVESDLQPVSIRPAGHVLDDRTEEIVGGIRLDVERQGSPVEARGIQQIGDEAIQSIGLLFDY
jgi:hypothetical protein